MVTVVLTVLFSGCGYSLVGGGYLDENVTQVAVELFENKSSESRAGISFTNELIREIQTKTDTEVVDVAKSTRKISGTIKAITFATLSRSNTETVVERQVTAVMDVKLVGPDGGIIWSVKDFSANESYQVSSNTVGDEANKREAVDKIALRSAERIVSQMMSNF